jgi:hypothetical protein
MRNIRICSNTEPVLNVDLTEEHIDHLDKISNERGISRAALIRKWLAAGERAEMAVIPDFEDPESANSTHQDPVEQLFREELPENSKNAISVDEMKEKLKDKVDGRVMELYRELDDIATVDGGDMYADE